MESAYFALRFDVWCLAIIVVAMLLNAALSTRTEKWFRAKKLIKPLIIFVGFFLSSSSVYLATELGFIFEGLELYPVHWSKLLFNSVLIYGLWSCIDCFTDYENKDFWLAAAISVQVLSAGIFLMCLEI